MTLLLGEIRTVGIEVINKQGQDFVIDTADFEIHKQDGTLVSCGSATIEGHKILTLFSANEVGKYSCIFTYRIGSETLKARVYVEVVK